MYNIKNGANMLIVSTFALANLKEQQLCTMESKREKSNTYISMRQKGIDLNHNFYVVVGKQCRTENVHTGHQYNTFI